MAKKESKEKERIFLFNNFSQKDALLWRLRTVVSIANNTVIPVCMALGMPILKPRILEWVNDREAFQDAFISKCKREVAEHGGYIARMVKEAAVDDFNVQLSNYPYPVNPGNTYLSPEEQQLIKIYRNTASIDDEKVTERTNIYLTDPDLIAVYHRCEDLCKYLDKFFAGNLPENDAFSGWAKYVYPTPDGFRVNPRSDFSKLVSTIKQ